MPKKQKLFKYKCLELMCNAKVRHDKWSDHCKKKHVYKMKHGINVSFKIIEEKELGESAWKPYLDENVEGRKTNEELNEPCSSRSAPGMISEAVEDSSMPVTEEPNDQHDISKANQENVVIITGQDDTVEDCEPASNIDLSLDKIRQDSQFDKDIYDPANLSGIRLTSEDIQHGLKLEEQNVETDYGFPVVNNRRFSPNWSFYNLPDGTKKRRSWLVYSKKNDSVYCLHCLLFALPNQHTVWTSSIGYQGWRIGNALRDIEQHENSKVHLSCQVTRLQWISGNHVSSVLCKMHNENIQHNREVLSIVIDCCKYLIEEMVAFRKSQVVEGKLPKLFKLLSKHSPAARVYQEKLEKARLQNKKLGSNFLSYRNIFDLITLMNTMVIEKIVAGVNKNQAFSIIVDSTQDVSRKEITTLILRFVVQVEEKIKPVERLVKVFSSADTTGANIKSIIMDSLKDFDLNPQNIVGQSMDGAGNMRGSFSGLKALVEFECKTALYVWCTSHRFALVIEKSIDVCPQVRDLFSLLDAINKLFSSGHKRHDVFVEKMSTKEKASDRRKRLHKVSTTRWSSKADAIKSILSCFDEVKSALMTLQDNGRFDRECVSMAKGLYDKLSDFDIIVTLHVVQNVFKIMHPATVSLQGVVLDYGGVQSIIRSVNANLKKHRTDESWNDVLSKANIFIANHDFAESTPKRVRRKKRFMDELGVDEPIVDQEQKLKVDMYYKLMDSLINQLQDRFSDHSLNMVKQMTYFTHSGVLELKSKPVVCGDISALCDFYGWDCEMVAEELNSFSDLYDLANENIVMDDILPIKFDKKTNVQDQEDGVNAEENSESDENEEEEFMKLKWIKHGFLKPYRGLVNFSGFKSLKVVYKTLLSLSVTSCSAERAMSRVRLIKTRLRSCMSDKWLSNLMVLSSEKDILEIIENEEVVDRFSRTTITRKKLLSKI